MKLHSPNLFIAIPSIVKNRSLIIDLIRRDVSLRYKGSTFGLAWALIHPLLMLSIYTLVFSAVLSSRWGSTDVGKMEFALILFAGLLPFNLFADCISKSAMLIVSNGNFVKKVVFPLELLPIISLGSALIQLILGLLVWCSAHLLFLGHLKVSVLYYPLLLIPLLALLLGISWFIASIGVFFRDTTQFIGHIVTASMFLSPIFYPASVFPKEYRWLIELSPLVFFVEQSRAILFFGEHPAWLTLLKFSLVSVLVACAGFSWFQKTRKGFADVL